MPYIKQTDRRRYSARQIDTFTHPGELNFAFTDLVNLYLKDKGLNYQVINDIVGALEGAKLEFYARVARPYEDTKIAQNGDVYIVNKAERKIEKLTQGLDAFEIDLGGS